MTTMIKLIDELWTTERNIISDGYDFALNRLSLELPMIIHKYATGESCWTWKVPEKWSWQEAYLETMSGERIIDANNNPLHIVSYSLPFEGIIEREELLRHLHTDKKIPDAIPFVFKYYERDWGLCLPGTIKNTLPDEKYHVCIRTRFEPGEMKVGEVIIPGESEESFVLAAHLCHPHMVNDDLTGVLVGLDVMRQLMDRPKPYFTYRFLILPETIGSVAYLSHNEDLIPHMAGGLFLEMLGTDQPLVLQHSFSKSSQVDQTFSTTLKNLAPDTSEGNFRSVIDNDERQFNAPGVRVPMVSLSRVFPDKTSPKWPFLGYHSNYDNPDLIRLELLDQAKDVVLDLLDAFEKNQFVVNKFKGEVFCSGYKIWIDHATNPEGHRKLFDIMDRCDGTMTISDIAVNLQISFQSVWNVIELLLQRDLVRLSRFPVNQNPGNI